MTTEADWDNDEVEGEDYVDELIAETMAEFLGPRNKQNAGNGINANQKETAGQGTAQGQPAAAQSGAAAPAQY